MKIEIHSTKVWEFEEVTGMGFCNEFQKGFNFFPASVGSHDCYNSRPWFALNLHSIGFKDTTVTFS